MLILYLCMCSGGSGQTKITFVIELKVIIFYGKAHQNYFVFYYEWITETHNKDNYLAPNEPHTIFKSLNVIFKKRNPQYHMVAVLMY